MAKAKYYRFIERNSWEGETWRFYIPAWTNNMKLKVIAALCKLKPNTYELDLANPLDEATVDLLCKSGESGYMAFHNKVMRVDLDLRLKNVAHQDPDDHLYKGKPFMTAYDIARENNEEIKKIIDSVPEKK